MYAAFHSVALHRDSITTAIDKIAQAGYAGVELNAETLPWAGPHVTPETSDEERAAIVAAAGKHGLRISSVGAHIDMLGGGPEGRRAAIDYVRGCIDLAVDVGSPVVHILSGALPERMSEEEGTRHFDEAVQAVVEHGSRRGITVGIEAIAGMLFHRVDDYRLLAERLPDTPFRVNFDPSHLNVQGEDPFRLVAEHGDRICNVHVKDGLGRYPDFAFPPLGQGSIDFAALLAALVDAGYDAALSVEYEANVFGYSETESQILDGSRRFLRELGV